MKDEEPGKTTLPAKKPKKKAPSPPKEEKPSSQPAAAENTPAKLVGTPAATPPVKPTEPVKKTEPPAKSPAKPPEPSKPVSWTGLAAAVDLPPPGKGAGQAVSLGKLDLDPKLTLNVQLLGGDTVAKSVARFDLQKENKENDDAAAPSWSIQMTGKNKETAKVARVWQDGGEWKIEWTAEAKEKAAALRYCGLQFSCEKAKESHFVALSTPKTVAPLAMDIRRFALDKTGRAVAHDRYGSDFNLPNAGVLRLQILPLENSLPKHEIKIRETKARLARPPRGKTVEAVAAVVGNKVSVKGEAIVMLTKDKAPRLAFDISFDVRGKEIHVDTYAAYEIGGGWMPFELNSFQYQYNAAAIGEAGSGRNRKPPQGQSQMAKAKKDQLNALKDMVSEMGEKAVIPFQVYAAMSEADDANAPRVVIFKSGQVEDAKPNNPKKNPKGRPGKGRNSPETNEPKL